MDWFKELAIVLLVYLTISFESQATDVTATTPDGEIRFKYLGCYRDKGKQRALPVFYYNARKYINWHQKEDYNFKKVIDMCATHAQSRSDLVFFGVQYYGECWGGNAASKYSRHGISEKCLTLPGVPGVGKEWTNAVYELSLQCKVNGKEYQNGDRFFVPQNPIQLSDVGCQSCSCDRGFKRCDRFLKCEVLVSCEKFIPASQGECCPKCACYHHNTTFVDGQIWIKRLRNSCYECTCVHNQAKCQKAMQCQANCPNPIQEPGKCCPICNGGAPEITEAPFFTIPTTTTRPPPTFPDFQGNFKPWQSAKEKTKRNYRSRMWKGKSSRAGTR